jgi:hypothetical protein
MRPGTNVVAGANQVGGGFSARDRRTRQAPAQALLTSWISGIDPARLLMEGASSIHWQAKIYVGAGRAVAAACHHR